jgi:cytidine deaminase
MKDLLTAATKAREHAYAPYSGFPVGAAVRGASGRVYAGCNVENAAYPLGGCAEAAAIAAMVQAGERRITEILVIGGGEKPCTPCGGCRQRLAEFAAPETPVHVCAPDGLRLDTSLGELLPHGFTLDAASARAAGPEKPEERP